MSGAPDADAGGGEARRETGAGADRETGADAGRETGGRVPALRAWIHGARPHTLPAAVAPVLVGGGLALAEGAFRAAPFGAALVAAVLLQVGTNLANDYFDYRRGTDTDDRPGGFVRITQAGLVPPDRVRRWFLGAFLLSLVPGAYLVWVGGWPILVIGLLSIAAGITYTGGPRPFGYVGLGDLATFLFFGLVAVAGTHYVQSLRFEPWTLLAGAGVGALTTAILVINNLRDRETDARAGKRTLAVLLGERGSRAEYVTLLGAAALVPVLGVWVAGWSPWAVLGSAAVLRAIPAGRTVLSRARPAALDRALVGTGRTLALYGFLFAAGLSLG